MNVRNKLLIATSIAAVSFSAAFAETPAIAADAAKSTKAAIVETKTTEVKKEVTTEVKKEVAPAAEAVKADAKKVEEMKKEIAPVVKH